MTKVSDVWDFVTLIHDLSLTLQLLSTPLRHFSPHLGQVYFLQSVSSSTVRLESLPF